MDVILLFALLGLGTGALIAGIALGVVLTYRGSGIINLATGAVAMVAGYAYWSLNTGFFGFRLGTPLAFAGALLAAALTGVLIGGGVPAAADGLAAGQAGRLAGRAADPAGGDGAGLRHQRQGAAVDAAG
jgi:branched-subunit amino acid ABC-type transport system permease component